MSRTSDRYPMSNFSDSEFLLNHSALINLEGDHRSMLLLGPATYRGPVVEVSRWGQLFNYFFATFSSRRVHQDREKIVSRISTPQRRGKVCRSRSNFKLVATAWFMENVADKLCWEGDEFKAEGRVQSRLESRGVFVQTQKFLSWWNSFQAFFCSSTFMCSSREGGGWAVMNNDPWMNFKSCR